MRVLNLYSDININIAQVINTVFQMQMIAYVQFEKPDHLVFLCVKSGPCDI